MNYALLYGVAVAGAGGLFVLNAAVRTAGGATGLRPLALGGLGLALVVSAARTLRDPAGSDVDPDRPGVAVVGALVLFVVALVGVGLLVA